METIILGISFLKKKRILSTKNAFFYSSKITRVYSKYGKKEK